MQVDQDQERQPLNRQVPSDPINLTTRNITGDASHEAAQQKRKKYIKWGIIGALILIALILVIVLPIVLTRKHNDDDNGYVPQPPLDKKNPYVIDKNNIVNDQVTLSGILKVGSSSSPNPMKTTSSSDAAHKHFFHDMEHLSKIAGVQKLAQEPLRDDPPPPPEPSDKLSVDWTKLKVDKNNQFAFNLKFAFEMLDYQIARFTLTDNDNARFSIPEQILNKPGTNPTMRLEMLGFQYSLEPFSFSFSDVTDKSNVYVNTSGQTLVFMDKYIQMDFTLPSQNIYGLGERVHEFNIGEGTWTMWASGQMSPYDDGMGRKGTYGVHPFIMVQSGKRKDDFFGMFFRNANAQSPVIRFNEDGTSTLSYITIGGQIEAYFFLHGSAKDVIQQYHNVIGKPYLPPFWAMGWQQASWKYTTQDLAQAALKGYSDANMPLDAIYFDIPYMDNYQDFTVDTKAFPDLANFTKQLQANNQKLVVIVDAAISAENTTNKYYQQGNSDNAFIQSGIHQSDKYGKNLIQAVWPKKAVFLDWLHDKVANTWSTGLFDLYKQVQFDGLWLDMNEPSGFVDGELDPNAKEQPEEQPTQVEAKEERRILQEVVDEAMTPIPGDDNQTVWYDSLNGNIRDTFDTYHLPFVVRNKENNIGNWDHETLSLNATHPGFNNEKEYNLHSLYGHMMAWRTRQFLDGQNDNRPFILSRSTFASSGRFASHWLGDNFRDWKYMRYSVSGIMNMNMFGIPHTGADVCGFFGEKRDDEMCLRWIQLATFYPLARAHQNLTFNGQPSDNSEPFTLSGTYKDQARLSILDRYQYLRMMYTCLFEVSQNGGSCFDPLFYHFPNDAETYKDYESSFMVANNLKVSPILDKLADGATTFKSYFPQGKWVNLADLTEIIDTTKGGAYIDLKVRSTVNVHLMQGGLIPYQSTTDGTLRTTTDLLQKPISIIANRDDSGHAEGTVFLDQGISQKELFDSQYEYYQVKLQAKSFQFQLKQGNYGNQPHVLSELLIVNGADLNNVNFACGMDSKMNNAVPMKVNYIAEKQLLRISPDTDNPIKFSDITNVYFGSSSNGDINMCDPLSNQYKVKGDLPDLNTQSVTLTLQNLAGSTPDLQAKIAFTDSNIINVKWTYAGPTTPDGKRTPVEVPDDLVNTQVRGQPTQNLGDFITITANPFSVKFLPRNKLDKTPYFTLNGMILDSYLNQINAQVTVPSGDQFKGIFGLGERANKDFFYEDGVYTIWGMDHGTPDEDGKPPSKSMYGTHPFFMFRHAAESYAGVFYKLAHAQDWFITNDKTNGIINLKTIATGGLGDLYIMTDQQFPQTIIDRYYSLVGDPVLIPQWALGWNQCKWGYLKTQDLIDSVANYKKYSIPLDVQWSDIDYMSNYKDFTYDNTAFKGLPDFVDQLHQSNQKFVPILDIGVAMRPGQNYSAYDEGIQDDVFIKINGQNGLEPFIGKVWPNEAHYPDFFNPKTTPWWHKQLSSMYSQIKFDGLWEDMNEVSNFCEGLCYDSQRPNVQVKNLLPYTPSGGNLESHTATLDAQHYNNYLQLDTHSYTGTLEVKATHEWFRDVQKQRTFIIERSSFAGMGKFGSRWLGDNDSNPRHMGYSVTGIMLMNMFGIQLSGVDICGFGGNTTPELCARWHTVGAFYPFSRNHNSIGNKPQEPWQFQDEYEKGMTYMDVMRSAIQTKYSMVRYMYTQLFLASQGTSQNYRKSFYKPMFFEFPEDINTYANLTYNVMLGDALKLSINSQDLGHDVTTYYFPAGVWCDLHHPETKCLTSTGQNVDLPSKAYDYGLHLREGYLIPHQNAAALKAMTTVDLQNQPVDFHILGSKVSTDSPNWRASGVYVNDDGLSLDITDKWNRYDISVSGQFSGSNEQITLSFTQSVAAKIQGKDDPTCNAMNQNDYLNQLFIYNAKSFLKSSNFVVNGVKQDGKTQVKLGSAAYDANTDRIIFTRDQNVNVCLSVYPQIVFTPQK